MSTKIIKNCLVCGHEFKVKPSHSHRRKTCSKACLKIYYVTALRGANNPNWKGGKRKKFCLFCNTEYYVIPSLDKSSKFCSRKCQNTYLVRKYWSTHKKANKSLKPARKRKVYICKICKQPMRKGRVFCKKCTFFGKRKVTTSCKICGRALVCYKSRIRSFCSIKCRSKGFQNEGNPRYIDGRTPIMQKIRASDTYKQWRDAIFQRDKYTCRCCGQIGYNLHAHHIKPFSEYPELRFSFQNGITLCSECHGVLPRRIKKDSPILHSLQHEKSLLQHIMMRRNIT